MFDKLDNKSSCEVKSTTENIPRVSVICYLNVYLLSVNRNACLMLLQYLCYMVHKFYKLCNIYVLYVICIHTIVQLTYISVTIQLHSRFHHHNQWKNATFVMYWYLDIIFLSTFGWNNLVIIFLSAFDIHTYWLLKETENRYA